MLPESHALRLSHYVFRVLVNEGISRNKAIVKVSEVCENLHGNVFSVIGKVQDLMLALCVHLKFPVYESARHTGRSVQLCSIRKGWLDSHIVMCQQVRQAACKSCQRRLFSLLIALGARTFYLARSRNNHKEEQPASR